MKRKNVTSSTDEYSTEEIAILKSPIRGDRTPDEPRTLTLNFDSQEMNVLEIRTPDPPSPLTYQLVGTDFRPISLPLTVARSENPDITSPVRPLTVLESEIPREEISVKPLTVPKTIISSRNTVNEITQVPSENAAIRIEQKALRKNKAKRRKIILKCKTCYLEIKGTRVPEEFDSYSNYKQQLIIKRHKKKLTKIESFYCNICN